MFTVIVVSRQNPAGKIRLCNVVHRLFVREGRDFFGCVTLTVQKNTKMKTVLNFYSNKIHYCDKKMYFTDRNSTVVHQSSFVNATFQKSDY